MYGIELTCLTSPNKSLTEGPLNPSLRDCLEWAIRWHDWFFAVGIVHSVVFSVHKTLYTHNIYLYTCSLIVLVPLFPCKGTNKSSASRLPVVSLGTKACSNVGLFFVWGKVLNTKINEYKCLWSTAWDGRCLVYYVDGRRRRRLWQETAGIARGRSMTTVARCCCCCSCELYIAFSLIFFFKQSVAG